MMIKNRNRWLIILGAILMSGITGFLITGCGGGGGGGGDDTGSATTLADYNGGYYGTYSGDESGDWCLEIKDGDISGWAWDREGDDYALDGSVTSDGSMVVGSADDGTVFSGSIEADGDMSGTWSYTDPSGIDPDEEGTFKGQAGNCPKGDITIDEDLGTVAHAMTQALGGEAQGGVGYTSDMVGEAFDETGLGDALEAETLNELLTLLGDYDSGCGDLKVNLGTSTVEYTITGGQGCVFTSGTITVSNINTADDGISFTAVFKDVQGQGCSLDGTANITITQVGSNQIEVAMEFVNVDTCTGTINGTMTSVYSTASEDIVSATADFEAAYEIEGTQVSIDATLVYDGSTETINGDADLTMDGNAYDITLSDMFIDGDCGVPTAGSMTVDGDGLSQPVVFDFSGTTCASPTVTTTVNGRTVTFRFL